MRKKVYISADYAEDDGDRCIVDLLNTWGNDNLHKVDFVDMAKVASGSVSNDPDCRICDLKKEFNQQINASSTVICIVGDKTASRTAGCACDRLKTECFACYCTPYKENAKGRVPCKALFVRYPGENEDLGEINSYSYLKHEFLQAKRKNKKIVVLYNSLNKQSSWLPSYMADYELSAKPFWVLDENGNRIGDYAYIKEALGF